MVFPRYVYVCVRHIIGWWKNLFHRNYREMISPPCEGFCDCGESSDGQSFYHIHHTDTVFLQYVRICDV